MTGYEEILTDPSYAGQIITFTFPHIGVVGTNEEDIETVNLAASAGARGAILRADVDRALQLPRHPPARRLAEGARHHRPDRHRHARADRDDPPHGMPNAVIAHNPDGEFDRAALLAEAKAWPGIDGMDLVPCRHRRRSATTGTRRAGRSAKATAGAAQARYRVVAIDYGVKRNILRLLSDLGCAVTVVPATTSAEEILALKPDGVFLSNGPGDPAETGKYAVPVIQALLETRTPMFGICLGHQMLGLAVGAKTMKMPQGHHGANHPVMDYTTDKVEIVSMNHGFAVDPATLPANAEVTHVSLFDGSNCGIALTDRPAFSVQYHPEASPGPRDSHYLFRRFVDQIVAAKAA